MRAIERAPAETGPGTMRLALLLGAAVVGAPGHAAEIGLAGTVIGDSVGLGQNIAVVLCEYLGDDTPFLDDSGRELDSESLAELMDDRVNPYLLEATRQPSTGVGLTTFDFIPVPGKCQFEYADEAPAETSPAESGIGLLLTRELSDALEYADAAVPGLFDATTRVIFAVNAPKRAIATWMSLPMMLPNSGFTMVSAAAIGLEDVAQASFSTIAHELGHQLGLPDLYQLDGVADKLVGRWAQMGWHRLQNFTAYSRYIARWIEDPGTRVRTLTSAASNGATVRVDVPGNANGNPELIRFDASPDETGTAGTSLSTFDTLLPFIGYYVEVRDPTAGLDANISDDGAYAPGVLIYRHTDWLNSERGFSPRPLTLQHPSEPSPLSDASVPSAAFGAGDAFTDPALGLTIRVGARNPDGSFDLSVTWTPPPRPDLVITDLLLDSPVNGAGTTWFPELFGDPVMDAATVTLLPPSVALTRPAHTMTLTIRNRGAAPSPPGLSGSLNLLGPAVLAGFDALDPNTWLPSSFRNLGFLLPPLPPGGVFRQNFSFVPRNSFIAIGLIDVNDAEVDLALLNNVYIEPFLDVPLLPFASPYPDLELETDVENVDDREHVVAFSMDLPDVSPELWKVSTLKNARMRLDKGERDRFALVLQAPPPDIVKPDGQLGTVATTAWMDEGDSVVPIMSIPRHFRLTKTAKVELDCKGADGKYALGGRLVQIVDGSAAGAIGGAPLTLSARTELDGERRIPLETDANGEFRHTFVSTGPSTRFVAAARFPGTLDFADALSAPCSIEQPQASPGSSPGEAIALVGLDLVRKRGALYIVATLSGPAPEGGTRVEVFSSAPRLIEDAAIDIADGRRVGAARLVPSRRYFGQAVDFKASHGKKTLVASTGHASLKP